MEVQPRPPYPHGRPPWGSTKEIRESSQHFYSQVQSLRGIKNQWNQSGLEFNIQGNPFSRLETNRNRGGVEFLADGQPLRGAAKDERKREGVEFHSEGKKSRAGGGSSPLLHMKFSSSCTYAGGAARLKAAGASAAAPPAHTQCKGTLPSQPLVHAHSVSAFGVQAPRSSNQISTQKVKSLPEPMTLQTIVPVGPAAGVVSASSHGNQARSMSPPGVQVNPTGCLGVQSHPVAKPGVQMHPASAHPLVAETSTANLQLQQQKQKQDGEQQPHNPAVALVRCGAPPCPCSEALHYCLGYVFVYNLK